MTDAESTEFERVQQELAVKVQETTADTFDYGILRNRNRMEMDNDE